MKKVNLIVFLFGVLPLVSNAQSPIHLLKLSIIPQSYSGDLSPGFNKWNAGASIGFLFNRKEKLNGSLTLGFGQIDGQDPDYQPPIIDGIPPTPNTFFKTKYISFNYDLRYHFIKKQNYWVFVNAGIGLIRFDPKDRNGNSLSDQPETRFINETYNQVTFIFPIYLGVAYFLPNHYGVNLEFGFLNTITDYLDNVSDWGIKSGIDNVLQIKISFMAPLSFGSNNPEDVSN